MWPRLRLILLKAGVCSPSDPFPCLTMFSHANLNAFNFNIHKPNLRLVSGAAGNSQRARRCLVENRWRVQKCKVNAPSSTNGSLQKKCCICPGEPHGEEFGRNCLPTIIQKMLRASTNVNPYDVFIILCDLRTPGFFFWQKYNLILSHCTLPATKGA